MPAFRQTIEISASPDQVWDVLGDLASIDRWIPGVTSVTVDGLTRRCTFGDGHSQNEQILDYSPTTHSYRYVIEGAPCPSMPTPALSPWSRPATEHPSCGNRASHRSIRPWRSSWPTCGSPIYRWSCRT
jgi:hypothetical protein